jgi:hypothetical protein
MAIGFLARIGACESSTAKPGIAGMSDPHGAAAGPAFLVILGF